jgi:hypothetical protein
MAESKAARSLLQTLVARGSLPALPAGLTPADVARDARAQGVAGLLLKAAEADPSSWAGPLAAELAQGRRALLVRTLGQVALAGRALGLLQERGIRALPLKGAVLAESVYDVESDRPMSDVDVLALERWPEAVRVLEGAGFNEFTRGDHAWVCTDPASGGLLELHRSVTSCPGLFPLAGEAMWERSRPGGTQLPRWPSPEDLLVQLALHAAFQHALVLSLVQWLDFRRVLERETVDPERLHAVAAASRAEVPLAAALLVAESVVAAPVPAALASGLAPLPRGLTRWLDRRRDHPLAFVSPTPAAHARLRWELLAGRRPELLWRTLVVPGGPEGDEALPVRVGAALGRGLRLARDEVTRPKGAPAAVEREGEVPETPFREELLRECLASFPWVRLTVSGACMEPHLADGEKVHLVHPRHRRPRLGDVVLARGHDGLRLHRLVWAPPLARAGLRWRTKADRGRLLDPSLARGDVLGVVVAVENRPSARLRRPGRAVASLARGVLARLRMGARAAGAEATP